MKLKTEIINDKQKALIISEKNYLFFELFKKQLKKYSLEIFFSLKLPSSIQLFDYLFFFNKEVKAKTEIIKKNPQKKFIFIFLKDKHPSSNLKKTVLNNLKIIKIKENFLDQQDIEKILWFSLSENKENFLPLRGKSTEKNIKEKKVLNNFFNYFSVKYLIILIVILIFVFNTLFIPFLILSSFLTYQNYKDFKKEKYENIYSRNLLNSKITNISEKLYFSRSLYHLLGLGLLPDNILELNKNAIELINKINNLKTNLKIVQKLIFLKNKTNDEKNDLKIRFDKLTNDLESINNYLMIVNQKIPFENFLDTNKIRAQILEVSDQLEKIKKISQYFFKIISQPKPQRYLVFFVNNREIRPGGGFLGSFAILEIKDYQIEEIKVYDVYDADGQLTFHIEPPRPLAKYLGVNHFFLRDSNFSPDFIENYQKAIFFLEKTLKIADFQGGILLTTNAIENILSAFGNLYLPDFKETINSSNFYIKTQHQVENNFFPGSTQKKSFLSSTIRQLILNLENVSFEKLIFNLKKSLEEKQMVIYIENDQEMLNFLNRSFWSGRVVKPQCLTGNNCLLDYLFPFDANVGANKANFFVNRYYNLKTIIDSEGKINHSLSIQYKNLSPSKIFPTGNFRNYFQILLPKDVIIKNILKNGVIIDEIDQKGVNDFKLIGFFFEVLPKKTVEIKINYQLKNKLNKNRQFYQLIFQKQIGSSNSDLILDYILPKNITSINQNFSPLVKNNQILYNTTLSTDKIFIIEFNKN